jgi:hypothetical protein
VARKKRARKPVKTSGHFVTTLGRLVPNAVYEFGFLELTVEAATSAASTIMVVTI